MPHTSSDRNGWPVDTEPFDQLTTSNAFPSEPFATKDRATFHSWRGDAEVAFIKEILEHGSLAIPDFAVEEDSFKVRLLRLDSALESEAKVAKELMKRAQALGIWFIENGSPVDLSLPGWRLLALVRDDCELVGYLSMFDYLEEDGDAALLALAERDENVPSHQATGTVAKVDPANVDSTPGCSLRICQVVVLPIVQRRGLGHRLVDAVFACAEHRAGRVETVSVEDPCPAFSSLLDVHAARRCKRLGALFGESADALSGMVDAGSGTVLKSDVVRELSRKLLLTSDQLHRTFEAAWAQSISGLPADDVARRKAAKRQLRAFVKHRLAQEYAEDLADFEDDTARSEALADACDDVLQEYKRMAQTL